MPSVKPFFSWLRAVLVDQIAKELGCCTKTVKGIKHNFKLWQSHQAPSERPLGRPPKISDATLADLLEHLLRHPSADLEEMRSFVYDQFGVIVSASNISRTLKKSQWTKKKIRKNAAERSQVLRDDWLLRLSDWTAEQLMFVDEFAANEKTGDRKYGWAPVGVTPDESVPAFRSERYSVLPCYTVDGYIACKILKGSFNQESFTAFIRDEVLPLSSRYPGPRSVLVMDNASIHKSQDLCRLCAEAGVRLEYLPPYSPDYNPIEESFAELKAWMRKNKDFAEAFEKFEGFLWHGIEMMANKAGNHFRSCNIHFEASNN
ncbi:DDE superfamily endonuclease-domain-containing protein [Lipomyces tetrasporus]